jgi:hypothetical protein
MYPVRWSSIRCMGKDLYSGRLDIPQIWRNDTTRHCETTSEIMGCNLYAVTSCFNHSIGSWAATAVDGTAAGGASAGALDQNLGLPACRGWLEF